MAAVIEVLREEHRNIARLHEALEHQITIFQQADTPDYDVIRGIADYFVDYPDVCHLPKEDVIFQHLREKFPREASTIGDLRDEHRKVHERARQFRATVSALLNESDIARTDIVDTARAFIDKEREHMQLEEESFFPMVEQWPEPLDWLNIESALAERQDPLLGVQTEELFRNLRERLLAWEQEYRTS